MGMWGNIKEKFKSAGRKVKEKFKSVGRKIWWGIRKICRFYRKTCRENKHIEGNNKNGFVCENGGKYGKNTWCSH